MGPRRGGKVASRKSKKKKNHRRPELLVAEGGHDRGKGVIGKSRSIKGRRGEADQRSQGKKMFLFEGCGKKSLGSHSACLTKKVILIKPDLARKEGLSL